MFIENATPLNAASPWNCDMPAAAADVVEPFYEELVFGSCVLGGRGKEKHTSIRSV